MGLTLATMLDFETLFEMNPSPKVVVTYNPRTTTPPQPFAFILNVSRLVGGDALEILPGGILKRANAEEIDFIRKVIESLFGTYFSRALWETRRPKSGQGRFVKLPVKQWRYFVRRVSSTLRHLAWEFSDVLPLSFGRLASAC